MRLAHRHSDGSTLRQHLQAAVAAGAAPDSLLLATVPADGASVWHAFTDLARARPQGMGASGGIPPSELIAWQRLHGVALSPWEVDTVMAIDAAVLAVAAELRAQEMH